MFPSVVRLIEVGEDEDGLKGVDGTNMVNKRFKSCKESRASKSWLVELVGLMKSNRKLTSRHCKNDHWFLA
jgi:hypothetical protein